MSPMPPTDSIFLMAEKRENPMHVGGLHVFKVPDGAGPDYVNETYHRLLAWGEVQPWFRLRPQRSLASLGQWSWGVDEDIDLEYHARLSALPRPGRVRELLELTSRLHGTLLDRQRPLWEFNLIEGLTGNRFAVYMKLHHSLTDGVSALRLLSRTLSTDPTAMDMAPPWAVPSPPPSGKPAVGPSGPLAAPGPSGLLAAPGPSGLLAAPGPSGLLAAPGPSGLLAAPVRVAHAVVEYTGQLAGFGRVLARTINQGLREESTPLPMQAPKTILNVPITGARRFAAQSWPLERLRAVRSTLGGTTNDLVLAMCSGALRHYLLELGALPDRPLVAMVPVSLRANRNRHDPNGNALGTILCNLGTHLADPAQRHEQIQNSMARGKRIFAGLTPLQVTALSALVVAPLAAAPMPGVIRLAPPSFNLVISNVPGPVRPLYWSGARLEGIYPLSIPIDGLALNITVTTYAGNMEFGLIGCRRNVPHLQRLLTNLETALVDLADAAGLTP
jgi:diacylglycerol O-acyltransferase / wax synthase